METPAGSRILVTGGAGFVGRALVRHLGGSHEVCVVDSLLPAAHRLTAAELDGVRFARIDIRDAGGLARVIADFMPEAIVHLAAVHFIPDCEREPGNAAAVNVAGTVNLLDACPVGCRFVLASSAAVYRPQTEPHVESSPLAPADVYGFTKLQSEEFVRHFSRRRGLASVIVRLFNVAGPGETNPHVLPEIVAQMRGGRRSIALGNTWPKRDYIHVEDAAAGFAAVATRGEVAPGEPVVVNLGTSCQYSVDELLDRLAAVGGIELTHGRDADRVRQVDRPFLCADIAAIRSRFGWRPTRDIDDVLADLWRHPDFSEGLMERLGMPEIA